MRLLKHVRRVVTKYCYGVAACSILDVGKVIAEEVDSPLSEDKPQTIIEL